MCIQWSQELSLLKVNNLLLFLIAQQAHLCVNCDPGFTVFIVSNVYLIIKHIGDIVRKPFFTVGAV